MKNKIFKITLAFLILFVCLGMASASDDNDTDVSIQDNTPVDASIDDLETLINNTNDGGKIQLDKEYELNENKSILINKSLTFNGDKDKTIIEGNNNCLYLDVIGNETHFDFKKIHFTYENYHIDGIDSIDHYYVFRDNAKNIIFNNITFKNIKIQTLHGIEFNDCVFINSTLTSPNLKTKFDNCIIKNSKIELYVLEGLRFTGNREFLNCNFLESELKTISSTLVYICGGTPFFVKGNTTLSNSNFSKSKISIGHANTNITKSIFNNTDIFGFSNSVNIDDSEFYNQNIDFTLCKTNMSNSIFNNVEIILGKCYYSIESQTNLKNCSLSNSKLNVKGFRFEFKKSQINISDCDIENSYLEISDALAIIKDSKFNKTELLLFFTDLRINSTRIYNNNTIENTIKTKLYEELKNSNGTVIEVNYYEIKTDYQVFNTTFINETGKYQLNSEDISKNTYHIFTLVKKDFYYPNDEIVFELKDQNGNPISGQTIYVCFNDIYGLHNYTETDLNGIARVKFKFNRTGDFTIYAYFRNHHRGNMMHEMTFNITVVEKPNTPPVEKIKTFVKAPKITNKFKKSKYFKVTIKNNATKKVIPKIKVKIKVYTGKKYKTYILKTNKNGIAKINTKNLKIGKHKVLITSTNAKYIISAKSQITIKK